PRFGGVDTAKFHGNLTTLPIEKKHGQFDNFFVNLTDLRFSHTADGSQLSSGKSTLLVPVLLDSRSIIITLPKDIFHDIFHTIRVIAYDVKSAEVDCGLGYENFFLGFTLSTATVSVPMSEFSLPIPPDRDGNGKTEEGGTPLCRLGITYTTKPTSSLILGNTFLRSAYVAYDMSNNEISIAPTIFNAIDSNIVKIDTGDENRILNLLRAAETTSRQPSSTSATQKSGLRPVFAE
ncbi:hypothetical protein MMC07_009984, partial [Pseudocyphellaria aurata]|nr:hypothetical protein [Pseudocyphellaria aurata]